MTDIVYSPRFVNGTNYLVVAQANWIVALNNNGNEFAIYHSLGAGFVISAITGTSDDYLFTVCGTPNRLYYFTFNSTTSSFSDQGSYTINNSNYNNVQMNNDGSIIIVSQSVGLINIFNGCNAHCAICGDITCAACETDYELNGSDCVYSPVNETVNETVNVTVNETVNETGNISLI